jgi:3-oxoacyl-[acyl-carrier-protein] synthase II
LSEPVFVTGLGTLGAWGSGCDGLAAALAAGAPLAVEIDRAAGYHLPGSSRRACLLPAGALAGWLSAAESRRMSPPSKLAVAAARMGLRCAGIDVAGESEEAGTAVVIATAFGPSTNTEILLKQILFENPEAASPSLFMESVANAPAAQIAIALKARGASLTVCQREAGPLIALGTGAAEIAAGRAGRVLAGSVDEMTPLLHALLDRFGSLARSGSNGAAGGDLAQPFDLRRNGFLAAEGATVVLLETAESAAERGRQPLARVHSWGSAFDPTAPQAGWGTGHAALARSLRRGLERAGLDLGDVDLIVSGASGARAGDRLEGLMLRAVWGERPLPPVLAPKAVVGEYGGGFLGAAVMAAAGSPFGPTAGFSAPDPELGVVPYDGGAMPSRPSTVLVTSLAAGGAAAWLVLGAP